MELAGYMNLASNNADTFTNSKDSDFLIFTHSNSQTLLFGVNSNASASFIINSNVCYFNSNTAIGTSNVSEIFEVKGGNAKFGSNLYVMSNMSIGLSNPLCAFDLYNGVANIWSGLRYAVPNNFMAPGSLTIGDGSKNYGGGIGWSANTAGIMLECSNNTEICVHDYATRIASLMYYQGSPSSNVITLGRSIGTTNSTISIPGYLGIGTTNPGFPLHVATNVATTYTYGYLSGTGQVGSGTFATVISGRFNGAVSSAQCQSFSDSRIKKNILPLSESNFSKLNPVTYNYIDKVQKSTALQYGLIAQEVQEIFPDVVSTTTDYIPNIYKTSEQISENIITLTNHNLESENEIIIYTNNEPIEAKVQVIDQNHFKIDKDLQNKDSVFVYGKKVDDFRSISYEKFVPILIKQIQTLEKQIIEQNIRIQLLESN
jgi:hypothetical protein